MKVKFLQDVIISDVIFIYKGEEFEAKYDGDYIMIRMKDDSTVKAPLNEITGILEIWWKLRWKNLYQENEIIKPIKFIDNDNQVFICNLNEKPILSEEDKKKFLKLVSNVKTHLM